MSVNLSSVATILCIDDDRDVLNLLKSILAGEGYAVITAVDGKQGIMEAQKNRPDLILLDITMPGMDGYEVCRMIKNEEVIKDIPIFFLTAKNENEDEVNGLLMGAVDYIKKPFYAPIVKSRIKTQLELKIKTDMLERLAAIDGLTNIYNRRKFDEILDLEWKRAFRNKIHLSLLICDVDHFKKYNDNYGHAAGDDCLKSVCLGMKEILRRPADFLARYGGEEFAVILPETEYQGAGYVATRLLKSIECLNIPHVHSPVVDHVTISIGMATSLPGTDCASPLQLIKAADAMLYVAKQSGRNQFQGNDLSIVVNNLKTS